MRVTLTFWTGETRQLEAPTLDEALALVYGPRPADGDFPPGVWWSGGEVANLTGDVVATYTIESETVGYIASDRLPTASAVVGARVSVPDWRKGTVIGWSNGEITVCRGTSVDPTGSYVVRLDSTGREALYFGYSLGRELS